jgi:hypothetical protein
MENISILGIEQQQETSSWSTQSCSFVSNSMPLPPSLTLEPARRKPSGADGSRCGRFFKTNAEHAKDGSFCIDGTVAVTSALFFNMTGAVVPLVVSNGPVVLQQRCQGAIDLGHSRICDTLVLSHWLPHSILRACGHRVFAAPASTSMMDLFLLNGVA